MDSQTLLKQEWPGAGRRTVVGRLGNGTTISGGRKNLSATLAIPGNYRFGISVLSLCSETFIAPNCLRVKYRLLTWRGWERAGSPHEGSAVDSSAAWAASIIISTTVLGVLPSTGASQARKFSSLFACLVWASHR